MQESTEAPRLPHSDRAEMNDIIDHVRAGLTEDEQWALAARDGDGYAEWDNPSTGVVQVAAGGMDGLVLVPRGMAVHIARHDPARTLAEVEVIRQVINDYRMADRACMGADAGSPEYATIRAGRDAFKSVLKAYARATGWQPSV